jgi:hypothetical protein
MGKEEVTSVPPTSINAFKEQLLKLGRQLYHMCKKNTILQFRYWPNTLCQTIIGPLSFLLILLIIQSAFNNNVAEVVRNPPARDLAPVVACTVSYQLFQLIIAWVYH